MRTKTMIAVCGLLMGYIALGIFTHGQEQNRTTPGPEIQEKRKAVNFIRSVNTAEVRYRDKNNGSFADWDVISTSDEFKKSTNPQDSSDSTDILPGWHVRLMLAADKKSYVVVLTSKSDETCADAFVSDEGGLIRVARGMGCPA
jgi:hypothetical protein